MNLALNNLQWLICLKTKPNEITVVSSTTVVGVLTCYTLLYLLCDLKATQMNMQLK